MFFSPYIERRDFPRQSSLSISFQLMREFSRKGDLKNGNKKRTVRLLSVTIGRRKKCHLVLAMRAYPFMQQKTILIIAAALLHKRFQFVQIALPSPAVECMCAM